MAHEVTTPPKHSKRVQAWIYTVMNPLIESLRRETRLLDEGNLSWRSYSKRCEYVRPIREYIQSPQWPNYEDFVADQLNSGFTGRFERHDRQVAELESTATRFFIGLTESNEFQRQVDDALGKYVSMARGNPQYPDLGTVSDLQKVIAEYVINRVSRVPHHYMTRKFWEDHAGRFEHYRTPPSLQELDQASAALNSTAKNLLADLERHRHDLVVTYDIPAAPMVIEKSHSADVDVV